jgi:polysaccharide biosynthesis protein PslG
VSLRHVRLRTRVRRASLLVNRRRAQAAVALGALLWIAAVAAAVLLGQSADRGPQAAPLPETVCAGPEIGVHSNLAFEGDPQRIATTVAAIHDLLGAQVVRESLLWNQVEPVEGRLDWSGTDSAIEELRSAGIEPLLVVLGSPSWANGVPATTPRQYLRVPPTGAALDTWLSRYSEFLALAVRRYHDYVRRWEIWNEPNLAAFWGPRPDPVTYRRVYETLRATILRVDPKAEVAVGGLASLTVARYPNIPGLAFLRRLTRTRPPIDNVAIHPYTTDDHPPDLQIPGENNFDDIARVHDQLVAEGVRASIWVTEWGWSSAAVGKRLQARYVDRSLAMLEHRYRFVRVATYFLDHDLPPLFLQGLLDEDLQPKPAALPFRRHADLAASRCHPSGAEQQRRRRHRVDPGRGSPAKL